MKTPCVALTLCVALTAHGTEKEALREELEALKARIAQLEKKLNDDGQPDMVEEELDEVRTAYEADQALEPETQSVSQDRIDVGGAVRFQYSFEDYVPTNRDRAGDLDLDTIRINFDGRIADVLLSAELRYYQYMEVVHHAWVGYQFDKHWQGQVGITKVPFGVLPYNSHNFFFDTGYYVGLEDDYDAGAKLLYENGPWDIRLAFFKNDELGGVDGYVSDRSDRYSYDIVGERGPAEGAFAAPSRRLGEGNTIVGRLAHTWENTDGDSTELGLSLLRGEIYDVDGSAGDYRAGAVHINGNYGRWNLQLQAARYEYDLDTGAERLAVGAYAFFDTIPAEAELYTANLAYNLPVDWGPVTDLTFYSDNSLLTGKSAGLDDTTMNILGVAVAAGGLYTYFDLVSAENQPFIGGTLGANSGERNTRFNVNVGYYF